MKKRSAGILVGICFLLWNAVEGKAQIDPGNQQLAQQVFKKLLSVAPQKSTDWPPVLIIEDKNDINAFASLQKKNGKVQPVVVCYNGILQKVVDGDADRLAYILGHEIAHHVLGHPQIPQAETAFLQTTFDRAQELEADREGMELATKAGYSFTGGLSAIRQMIALGLDYSSFEGLSSDHPSWSDRIAMLDKDQANLWRSLSTFQNGVYFLAVQNYPVAQRAFRQVTKDFPDSYEAWANLGYALLMEYADSLDDSDLQHLDVGQIVMGGFYGRSKYLEGHVRGVNEQLWSDAVNALQKAIQLNPTLSLPSANLGVAYLLKPAGKDPAAAAKYLEESSRLASSDDSLDPIAHLAEETNLAVAYAADGDREKALKELAAVQQALDAIKSPATTSVYNAVAYNRAFLLAQSSDNASRKTAFDVLEKYLRTSDPSGMWWPSAYGKYSDLGKQFGLTPEPAAHVHKDLNLHFRPVTGLEFDSQLVSLGDRISTTTTHWSIEPSVSTVIPRTSLVRYDFSQLGISVMGTDQVLAIILTGKNAPGLPLQEAGIGNRVHQIRVGMRTAELDDLMQDADYDFRHLTDPEVNYRFYKDLGLAVLIRDQVVTEIVISQIPKQDSAIL